MSLIESYIFDSNHPLIINNGKTKLNIKIIDFKQNKINIYISFSDQNNESKTFLVKYFFNNESKFHFINKFNKIRITNFYLYNHQFIFDVDISMKLYNNNTLLLLDKRFNLGSDMEPISKISILLININNNMEFENYIKTNLLTTLSEKNFFTETVEDESDITSTDRNPFLIFTQKPNYEKNMIIKNIDGKGSYSWDIPMELPLFNCLKYLQLSFLFFLYPTIKNDNDATYNFTRQTQEIILENIEDLEYLISDLKDHFDHDNKIGLFYSVLFLKKLMENILIYSESDISYLKIIINDELNCIKLIQQVIQIWKEFFFSSNLEYEKNVNYDQVFSEGKKHLYILEDVYKNCKFSDFYDKIQVFIMETWYLMIANTDKNFNNDDYNKDNLFKGNEAFSEEKTLNTYYFLKFYEKFYKINTISTRIFNSYMNSLEKVGAVNIKHDKKYLLSELNIITKIRNNVCRNNILNLLRLKNFNRCIVFYSDYMKNDFRNKLKETIELDIESNIDFFEFAKYNKFVTTDYRLIKKYTEFDLHFYYYLLCEYIDQYLFQTEFDELDYNYETEIKETANEIKKLQAYTPLISLYFEKKNSLKGEKDQKILKYIAIYIYLLMSSNKPSYNHILNNNEYNYNYSKSNLFNIFENDIKPLDFSSININRRIGSHFKLEIKLKDKKNPIEFLVIDLFVEYIVENIDNIQSIY